MKALRAIIASLALVGLPATAQETNDAAPPPSLADLARAADFVALVQVADTDYEYTREYPIGGTAFLRVLIPYKVSRALSQDIVEVYEEGLHTGECYFESPTVLEEGRRHLVFLEVSPDVDDQYVALEHGCALDVLVTRENRYALRYPLAGIEVSDNLAKLARPMTFQDEHAFATHEELRVEERNALLASGMLEEANGRYRYTHGVELSDVRRLLGEDALTLDRSLKRVGD